MRHASFVEGNRLEGEQGIFAATTGHQYDSVFIQVTLATYITKQFQEWLTMLTTRLAPTCEAIRIAVMTEKFN